MMNKQLIHNSIQCPDGTILVSKHRYDFKQHIQEDGREYFVDGGVDYQRVGHSDDEWINLSVYVGDAHGKIREVFTWTRQLDANGNVLPEPEVVLLKDITDDHLNALVEWTLDGYPDYINSVFVEEVNWRKGE